MGAKGLDPEILVFFEQVALLEKRYPPPPMGGGPFELRRKAMDKIAAYFAEGGPQVAETTERWVSAGGRCIRCRVHRPRNGGLLPVLIHLHGGGWVQSSIETHDRLAREYATKGDVAVLSVDYALSPEAKFPQAIQECVAVVRHVADHGVDWGLDGNRMLVGGDSAGGNLAFATALSLRDTGGPSLRGILACYPVCDSRLDTPSYKEFGAGGGGLTLDQMAFVWDQYARDGFDRIHPLAAPLRADLTDLPPVLLVMPQLDVLRSECEAMVAKLNTAGVPVKAEIIKGMPHGFLRACGSVQKSAKALEMIGKWLQSVC
jgi:acetyl esterase